MPASSAPRASPERTGATRQRSRAVARAGGCATRRESSTSRRPFTAQRDCTGERTTAGPAAGGVARRRRGARGRGRRRRKRRAGKVEAAGLRAPRAAEGVAGERPGREHVALRRERQGRAERARALGGDRDDVGELPAGGPMGDEQAPGREPLGDGDRRVAVLAERERDPRVGLDGRRHDGRRLERRAAAAVGGLHRTGAARGAADVSREGAAAGRDGERQGGARILAGLVEHVDAARRGPLRRERRGLGEGALPGRAAPGDDRSAAALDPRRVSIALLSAGESGCGATKLAAPAGRTVAWTRRTEPLPAVSWFQAAASAPPSAIATAGPSAFWEAVESSVAGANAPPAGRIAAWTRNRVPSLRDQAAIAPPSAATSSARSPRAPRASSERFTGVPKPPPAGRCAAAIT